MTLPHHRPAHCVAQRIPHSPLRMLGAFGSAVFIACWALMANPARGEETIRAHGYSFYGDLSYPPISRISAM
jgi:hypothetical protein